MVEQVWQQQITGTKMYQVISKLALLKKDLKLLNASQFGNVSEQQDVTYSHMIQAQLAIHNSPSDFI